MTMILGLSGSLRAASSNTGLLLLAQRIAADGTADAEVTEQVAQRLADVVAAIGAATA